MGLTLKRFLQYKCRSSVIFAMAFKERHLRDMCWELNMYRRKIIYFFSSGDVETAVKFAAQLIDLGADASLRSRWTNMNALHYAAYFDVPELIRVILKTSKPKGKCWLVPVTNGCSVMASESL